ncbi:MAG: YdbL family protein [Rhodospirillaceae bacterium]|nr:YdbL family protein [Rhodospirillaceae bacterium]
MGRRPVLAGLAAIAVLAIGSGLLWPSPAAAQTLEDARAQGWIGERRDGYIGVVENAPGVDQLVQTINTQRRNHYQSIAAANNVPLSAVEAQAAETIINRLPSGAIYQAANGQWARR